MGTLRLGEALQHDVAHGFQLHLVPQDEADRVADQDLAGGGQVGEPRRQVHRIACDGIGALPPASLPGHDVADGDAAMHPEIATDIRGDLRHGREGPERGASRPAHVVAARNRRAEQRHDAVADMLVDRAAVALDDGVDGTQEAAQ